MQKLKKNVWSIFFEISTSHSWQHGDVQVIFLEMLPKFKIAATGQLQFFVGAKTVKLKVQNDRHKATLIFWGRKNSKNCLVNFF